MANVKITQLPQATGITPGDVLPIVQGGVTKKINASELGGGGIQIPKPEIRIGEFQNGMARVDISHFATQDQEWLNHSPQVWLFRFRRKGIKKKFSAALQADVQYRKPSKWAHPTNGTGTAIETQNEDGIIYGGGTKWSLNTEWNIPTDWKPHRKLNGFFFNTLQFFSNDGGSNNATNLSGFPLNDPNVNENSFRPTGQKNKDTARSAIFYFRFVIRDPNDNAKVLMGAPSEILRAYAKWDSTNLIGVGLTMKTRQW